VIDIAVAFRSALDRMMHCPCHGLGAVQVPAVVLVDGWNLVMRFHLMKSFFERLTPQFAILHADRAGVMAAFGSWRRY